LHYHQTWQQLILSWYNIKPKWSSINGLIDFD